MNGGNKRIDPLSAINYSALSHVGNVRSNNEDNLYCGGSILTPEVCGGAIVLSGEATMPCLFAVCDGMGGQQDGAFASFAAVSDLAELEAAVKTAPDDRINGLVQEYVTKVNVRLCDKMREKSARIGTTLALVIITPAAVLPYNIGDSRVYEYMDGKLRQISEEHTLTAQKAKLGVLTEEQARNDRDRHKLTRYLGIFEDEMVIEAEPLPALPLTEHRRLLLCSDGLTDMLPDTRISEILRDIPTTTEAADFLIKEALDIGGKDNITIIVLDIQPTQSEQKTSKQSAIESAKLAVTGLPKLIMRGRRCKT